jgi:imidazolonepropionase-like amidohydrolase
MRRSPTLFAVMLLCTTSPALAQQTLIENVTVFDGEKLVGKRNVLIDGAVIANPDFKGKAAKGVARVNGAGKTLMPGMIDAHVHAMQGLDTALLFGVTTQLDMFTPPMMNAEAKAKSRNGGNTDIADLYSAGFLATVPKGHGTQFGSPVPTLTTPQEADAWVAARIAEGSDYIKIVNEDGVTVGRPMPTLDAPTTAALIQAAKARGKLAVVHVQSRALAENAIGAGASGLVHLFFDKPGDDAFARLAKSKGAFITPTLTVFEVFSGRAGSSTLLEAPGMSGLLNKQAVDTVKAKFGPDIASKVDGHVKATITALAKAGVPILAGTDSGNPGTWYGLSMHRELELLVKAGLTPTQALAAATSAPAKAYLLAGRGRIAKGMKADLLLVDGDPTRDITATRNISEVWKNGLPTAKLRTARREAVLAEANAKPAQTIALPADGRILALSANAGKVEMKAPFGSWSESTDAIMGGESKISASVSPPGASGQPSLMLKGDVKQGAFAQWAGVGFMPGNNFSPVNLSAANALKFRARGTGAGFGVMGFSEAGGQRPSIAMIKLGKDWSEIVVPFSKLSGFDAKGAMMLSINALQPGPFELEIADVRLTKE